MKIAVMQPYVFPYLGYFQLINAVDVFVFYDDVNFIKKGFINRNSILINGEKHQFTIPCKSISQNRLIKDTVMVFDEKAKSKFIKTIQHAYQNAPNFTNVFPLLEDFIMSNNSKTISEFAMDSVKFVINFLGINKKWRISSLHHEGLRSLEKENRLIEITKREQAYYYINPIGGQNLYDKTVFEANGIHLSFLKSKPLVYEQNKNDFVPNLSIIDVIMFNSKDEVNSMLNKFEFV